MKKTKLFFQAISLLILSCTASWADALEDKMNSALAGKTTPAGDINGISGANIGSTLKNGMDVKLLQEKAAAVQKDPLGYFNSLSGEEKKKVQEITKQLPH